MKKAKFVIVLALFSFVLLSLTSSCQKSPPTQSTETDSFAAVTKADNPNSPPSIQCTTLDVEKTATGFWEKCIEYDWDIQKSVEPTEIEILKGMCASVTYTITVNRSKVSETEVFGVRGEIKVKNGGEDPTENLKIVDQVQYRTGDGQFQDLNGASLTILPEHQLASGEAKSYPYHIEFTPVEGAEYKNVVKVTITNHADHNGEEYGPTAEADFDLPAEPTSKFIDAEADISDVHDCPSGITCFAEDTDPWHVTASDEIVFKMKITNNSVECEQYLELKNKAVLKESDTGEERKDCATLIIYTGPCDNLGCTRTQGYWKNHPNDWPEGYSPDMEFFSIGKTWMEVFKTPPKKGDAYYILAHQFLTAVLNEANGAYVPPFVKQTMLNSKAWLTITLPPVPASSPSGQDAVVFAKILDDYNNGKMGVPHCDNDAIKKKNKKKD